MANFLSCDWGTSSFRLRLVKASNLKVLAEERSANGIASTYALWSKTGEEDPAKRIQFYLGFIQERIEKIEREQAKSLKGIPVIISGMASSSIGMLELPYKQLPFAIDGSAIGLQVIEAGSNLDNSVLLVSGVSSDDDVMRGEETQLIGIVEDLAEKGDEQVYIFPGTHSKHIFVKDDLLKSFKTYMTGEFFELLSRKSILHVSVEENEDPLQSENLMQIFKQGVRASEGVNLLHAAFLVRTNNLFGKLSKAENYSYLSGLLIGAELQDIKSSASQKINLCCGSNLKASYETALQTLDLHERTHIFSAKEADEAVITGHYKILNHYRHKL